MPANISARAQRQDYFLALAEKNRERAKQTSNSGLSNDYTKLADGYDEVARTLQMLERYPTRSRKQLES